MNQRSDLIRQAARAAVATAPTLSPRQRDTLGALLAPVAIPIRDRGAQ